MRAKRRRGDLRSRLTLRFNASSLRRMLTDHTPDFRNFEMSLRGSGDLFCLAEHEVLGDGSDEYAILYTFFREGGVFHFVERFERASFPPRPTRRWLEKVGDKARQGCSVAIGKVRVTDLVDAVAVAPPDAAEVTIALGDAAMTVGAKSPSCQCFEVEFRLNAGVFER